MPSLNIRDYGAKADGTSNNAPAIQAAIDTCAAAGGGRVTVPAGVFLTGSIDIKSNVDLHLEYGAELLGSTEREHYTHRMTNRPRSALITANKARNIAITGGGRINMQGKTSIAEDLGYIYKMRPPRPFPVLLWDCRQVTMRDITLVDAPAWTVRLSGCVDVTIHSIHIYNDLKTPNSDGIDLDRCRNVRISDCHIECGDDCIVLKAIDDSEGLGGCENITVRGCTLMSTSSALVIGCECQGIMRDVIFDSCVIKGSHRGLSIHLNEKSNVENVLFSNMIVETRLFHHKWWGRAEPIYICVYPWTKDHKEVGTAKNIRFVNVLARGENGVFIEAQKPEMIQDILLENVHIELNKTSKWAGGFKDIRPTPEDEGGPGEAKPLPECRTSGFMITRATNVTMRNCSVAWGENRPDYYHHAIEAHEAPGLKIEGFTGAAAHPDKHKAISIEE